VVLADLRRGVPVRLEKLCDGGILVLQSLLRTRHADLEKASAKRMLAGNEGCPASRAGLLGVVVGEESSLSRDAIDIRRSTAHHAAVVGTDIPNTDIVGHDDQDVGFSLCHVCASPL